MAIQHKHLIIRAEVEKPFVDGEGEKLKKWLKALVKKIKMKLLSGPHIAYADTAGNEGFTGCCLIETSHISIHIWHLDKPPLIQLDVYTCSHLDLKDVFDHLQVMKPTKVEYKYLDRESELKFLNPKTKDSSFKNWVSNKKRASKK